MRHIKLPRLSTQSFLKRGAPQEHGVHTSLPSPHMATEYIHTQLEICSHWLPLLRNVFTSQSSLSLNHCPVITSFFYHWHCTLLALNSVLKLHTSLSPPRCICDTNITVTSCYGHRYMPFASGCNSKAGQSTQPARHIYPWLSSVCSRWPTCAGGTTYQNSQNLWTQWVQEQYIKFSLLLHKHWATLSNSLCTHSHRHGANNCCNTVLALWYSVQIQFSTCSNVLNYTIKL